MNINYIHTSELFGDPLRDDKLKDIALSLSENPALFSRVSSVISQNNAQRRAESLAGLYLLSQNAKIPEDAHLEFTDAGKPYFKEKNIFFNISHSCGFVICATDSESLGIDVEKLRPIPNRDRLASRFFCEEEKEFIKNHADPNLAFLRIWTKKEAFLKYLGHIMTRNLCSYSTFDKRWNFSEFTIESNGEIYLVSVCSNTPRSIDIKEKK